MRKMIKEVFLGVRFLVSLYFLLVSFGIDSPSRSTVIVLTALYFSFSLLAYLKFEQARWMNRLVDVVFVPPVAFLTGRPETVFSLVPLMVVHANRSPVTAGVLFLSSVALAVYGLAGEPLVLFPTLILLTSAPLSALIPDFIGTIKKDRDSIKELRKAYRRLLQDFARWERDRRELDHMRFLIDVSTSSQDVREFLRNVKERFRVKKVHMIPKREIESYDPMMDREKGLLSVPVKLEEGNAVVIFEMESPFQLNDELLVRSLERAGRMVSLFVAGFEDSSSLGKAINIG